MSIVDTIKEAVTGKETDRVEKIVAGDEVYRQKDFQEYDMEVLQTPIRSKRVMFWKKGCNICPKWKRAIGRVNMRMLPKDRIAQVEIQRGPQGVNSLHPLARTLEPESAPEVWLDGIVIRGATSTEGQVGFLEGFLEDAIIISSSNEALERGSRR